MLSAGMALAAADAKDCPQEAVTALQDARELACQGSLAAALGRAQQAAKIAPQWPDPCGEMGLLYQSLGNAELAQEQYTRHQLRALIEEGYDPHDSLTHEIAEAEGLLIYLVNAERRRRGLAMLRPDADLAACARRHSEEMRDLGYFGHRSPRDKNATLGDRYRNIFGRRPQVAAENVARRYGTLRSFSLENIRKSHEDLMSSPGHRRNILWEAPNAIGVGIAVNRKGDYWITENFASPDSN